MHIFPSNFPSRLLSLFWGWEGFLPQPRGMWICFYSSPISSVSLGECSLTLYQWHTDLFTVENVPGKQMSFYACPTSAAAIIHMYAFQGGSLQSPTLPQIFPPMEDHGKSLWVSANISRVWDSQLFQTKMLIHNYQECKLFSDFFFAPIKQPLPCALPNVKKLCVPSLLGEANPFLLFSLVNCLATSDLIGLRKIMVFRIWRSTEWRRKYKVFVTKPTTAFTKEI